MGATIPPNHSRAFAAEQTEPPSTIDDPGFNQSTIIGRLVSEPDRRTLPTGVVAASFSLTVRSAGEKTTSVLIVGTTRPSAWELGLSTT